MRKVSGSNQLVEKNAYLDGTGMFLVYSPTRKAVIHATLLLAHVSEFRPACATRRLQECVILTPAERSRNCFSLMLLHGDRTSWSFVFPQVALNVWKNTIEFLIRR